MPGDNVVLSWSASVVVRSSSVGEVGPSWYESGVVSCRSSAGVVILCCGAAVVPSTYDTEVVLPLTGVDFVTS